MKDSGTGQEIGIETGVDLAIEIEVDLAIETEVDLAIGIVIEEIGQETDQENDLEIAVIEIERLVANDHVKKKGTKTSELKEKRVPS